MYSKLAPAPSLPKPPSYMPTSPTKPENYLSMYKLRAAQRLSHAGTVKPLKQREKVDVFTSWLRCNQTVTNERPVVTGAAATAAVVDHASDPFGQTWPGTAVMGSVMRGQPTSSRQISADSASLAGTYMQIRYCIA